MYHKIKVNLWIVYTFYEPLSISNTELCQSCCTDGLRYVPGDIPQDTTEIIDPDENSMTVNRR